MGRCRNRSRAKSDDLPGEDAEADMVAAGEGEAGYVLTVELLNGRGFYEQVYLDNRKRISKRLLRQEGTYILERTSRKEILRQFPEHAEYILQKNKADEQSQPQY